MNEILPYNMFKGVDHVLRPIVIVDFWSSVNITWS